MPLMQTFRLLIPALMTASIALPASAIATPASVAPDKRTITLSASGKVKAAPDLATITSGVTSEGQTAADALKKNNAAMVQVVDGLKEAGIAPKDIQTSGFSVSPVYERRKDGQASFITGYRVRNNVSVTVRDLAQLGDILDMVVSAGSNQIGSIDFGMAEPEELKDAARKKAMGEAMANAKLYAEAAGVELGPVLKIAEVSYRAPQPYRAAPAPMMAEAKAVPIEAGTMSIEARIDVTWELR